MKIDYEQFVTRKHIDFETYNKKFLDCDRLFGRKELSPDEEEEFSRLHWNTACFAYMYFRLDGLPLKLFPYQDLILSDHHRFKIFRAANQIGKSLSLDIQAAHNLLTDHGYGHNEAIVSKSLPQSTEQMRRVKGLLNTMEDIDWKEERGDIDNMSVITYDIRDDDGKLKYTNSFICAPCTEGLLGYSLHSLNLDEFEYWENDIKYFFNQIAQPRTYTTKGKITIFSNPNGQDSFVAELEEQRLLNSGRKKWHTYIFDFMDKPGNTKEEFEQLKHELSRQEFESTVAAIRSISSRNYFTPDEIERSLDPNLDDRKMVGKQPFFFLDVGAKHDQSVLVGGFVEPDENDERFRRIYVPIIHIYPKAYPLNRVAGSEVDESDGWHYEKSVKEFLKEWSADGTIPVFGVDATGNSGIVPLFEACGIHARDVIFSGPVKSGMYQRFKYFMEKGLLHRIKCKEWEYQAAHMEVKKSARGYLMIHHEKESDLDDCMDATAGLIHLADSPDVVEPWMVVI